MGRRQVKTMATPTSDLLQLSHDSDIHIQLVKESVTTWSKMEPDLVLLTEEGEKVLTQRMFLSFFSKTIRQMCSGISSPDLISISVPASKTSLERLLEVLLTGSVITNSRENLVEVAECADCLGIDLTDIQIGVKEEKKQTEKKIVKKARKKKVPNGGGSKNIKKEDLSSDITDQEIIGDNDVKKEVPDGASDMNADTEDKTTREKACTLCGKTFSNNSGLKQHAIVHSGEKPFKCDLCDKAFGQKGALLNHTVLHADEKPFKCSFCDKEFTQKGNMNTHMMKVHNEV